jgi:CRISPR-associated endonuclease/helicase Cas3
MDRSTGYYAHSTQRTDRSDWQPLAEHLRAVAELAPARGSGNLIDKGTTGAIA